jgi:hypothetical protein
LEKEIIFKDIWIDADNGNLITFIGILATSAFSILIYFVSLNTHKTNKQLFLIEKMRFKIDMLPVKQKQLNSAILECECLFQEISTPLNDYIFNEAHMERLIDQHIEWFKIRDQELEKLEPSRKLKELFNPEKESPLHKEYKKIKKQIV